MIKPPSYLFNYTISKSKYPPLLVGRDRCMNKTTLLQEIF